MQETSDDAPTSAPDEGPEHEPAGAALIPRLQQEQRYEQNLQLPSSPPAGQWNMWTGVALLSLILAGYIAACLVYGDYTGKPSLRHRSYYSAEGIVTGATDVTVPELDKLTKFDVKDYGAKGDGITLDTIAFQKAIKDASENEGGGVVWVSSGSFLIGGAVDLLSHTYLYVEEDAVIMGSYQEEDYPFPDSWEPAGDDSADPRKGLPILLRCKNQHHVGILGTGIIDGGAIPGYVHAYNRTIDKLVPRTFRPGQCLSECRPRLVLFEKCDNIIIQNVTLQNSPDWTLHVRGSSNALLENLRILGEWRWPNNDGIDVDSSINVTVANCTIDVADDAVCIKSTVGYGPLRNVLIRDNVVHSRSSAFKIGSATVQDITDVFVDRFYVKSGTNRGLGIQHRDSGKVQNIHFRNVVLEGSVFQTEGWWGNAEPFYVSTIPRHDKHPPDIGHVSNITFENIKIYDAANGMFLSSAAGGNPLVNLSFVNVHMFLVKYPSQLNGGRLTPQMKAGVEYSPPQRDYRPTEIEPQLVPSGAKINAVYMEGVDLSSTVCLDSSATFVKGSGSDGGGSWWGSCVTGANGLFGLAGFRCVYGGSPF